MRAEKPKEAPGRDKEALKTKKLKKLKKSLEKGLTKGEVSDIIARLNLRGTEREAKKILEN